MNRIFLLPVAGLAFALAGCPSPPDQTASTPSPTSGEPVATEAKPAVAGAPKAPKVKPVGPTDMVKVAFVTNVTDPFWDIANAGLKKADAELPNLECEFRTNSGGTASSQKEIVDDLLAKGVNGIAISPLKPALQLDMLNAAAGKALLITQDSDAAKSDRSFYLGTDNLAAGKQAGELIKKALPNGGDIMVFVGDKDQQNSQDRFNGIKEALVGTKIKVLDLRTDSGKSNICKDNASDTLAKYPNISAMVGLWSYNAPAILEAVKGAGKLGKVKVIGFDEAKATLEGIRKGEIVGTIVQQPFEFGYQSVKLLDSALRGKMPEKELIFVPTLKIEKGNVDTFEKQLNERLGKK